MLSSKTMGYMETILIGGMETVLCRKLFNDVDLVGNNTLCT